MSRNTVKQVIVQNIHKASGQSNSDVGSIFFTDPMDNREHGRTVLQEIHALFNLNLFQNKVCTTNDLILLRYLVFLSLSMTIDIHLAEGITHNFSEKMRNFSTFITPNLNDNSEDNLETDQNRANLEYCKKVLELASFSFNCVEIKRELLDNCSKLFPKDPKYKQDQLNAFPEILTGLDCTDLTTYHNDVVGKSFFRNQNNHSHFPLTLRIDSYTYWKPDGNQGSIKRDKKSKSSLLELAEAVIVYLDAFGFHLDTDTLQNYWSSLLTADVNNVVFLEQNRVNLPGQKKQVFFKDILMASLDKVDMNMIMESGRSCHSELAIPNYKDIIEDNESSDEEKKTKFEKLFNDWKNVFVEQDNVNSFRLYFPNRRSFAHLLVGEWDLKNPETYTNRNHNDKVSLFELIKRTIGITNNRQIDSFKTYLDSYSYKSLIKPEYIKEKVIVQDPLILTKDTKTIKIYINEIKNYYINNKHKKQSVNNDELFMVVLTIYQEKNDGTSSKKRKLVKTIDQEKKDKQPPSKRQRKPIDRYGYQQNV